MPAAFKTCPGCHTVWRTREELLGDPSVELIGFQVDITNPLGGLFLFNHDCGDTLAIGAPAFLDLSDCPVNAPPLLGTDGCEGHCLHRGDLDPCRASCECAYVREVLQIVRNWPKQQNPAASGQ